MNAFPEKEMLMRFIKKFGIATIALLFMSSAAFAICDWKVSNYQPDPSQPLKTVSGMWLQWLNNGTYTCTAVNGTHVKCTKGTEAYDTYLNGCSGSSCSADHYAGATYRNTSTWSGSQISGYTFVFAGGPTFNISSQCVVDTNHLGNPCQWKWVSCGQ